MLTLTPIQIEYSESHYSFSGNNLSQCWSNAGSIFQVLAENYMLYVSTVPNTCMSPPFPWGDLSFTSMCTHETLNQCWFTAGPTYGMLAQRWASIWSTSRVCWDWLDNDSLRRLTFFPLSYISELKFHPLEVVSRYRDPQLQVGEKYYLFNLRANIFKSWCLNTTFHSQ